MTIQKIQLVNPPLDTGIRGAGHFGSYPPLGLLYLGTYLKNRYPGKQVEILDGSIMPMEEMDIDGDMVGIGALLPTYGNALKIAERAKERGAYVILGNEHAKSLGGLILKRREYVDSVCISNQGWETIVPLVEYLEGEKKASDVPGLVYREGNEIKSNKSIHALSDRRLVADRSLVDLDRYSANYMRIFGHLHKGKIVPATTQFMKGCSWGARKGCLYCGINDIEPGHADPDLSAREYDYLKGMGANFIYDVGDDILSHMGFAKELIGNGVKIDFTYGRASGINDMTGGILEKLDIRRMNMGVDSGNDEMLRSLRKHNPKGAETNRNAAKILSKLGIEVYMSLVLGAPHETERSLRDSADFFEETSGYGNVIAVDPSVLLPIRGSAAWDMMMDDAKFREKYLNEDATDTEELARDWVGFACPDIDYGCIKGAVDRILAVAEKSGIVVGGFGVGGC